MVNSAEWVTAAATAVAALATVAVAWVGVQALHANKLLVRINQQLIEETATQAIAATRGAEASSQMIDEVRQDRTAAVQPFIVIKRGMPNGAVQSRKDFGIEIVNIGKGPAITCRYEAAIASDLPGQAVSRDYWRTDTFHLAADSQPLGIPAKWVVSPASIPAFERVPGDPGVRSYEMIVCRDQIGNKFRFVGGQPLPDVWQLGEPATDWSDGL